jgi:PAS domain S-box-containing protein
MWLSNTFRGKLLKFVSGLSLISIFLVVLYGVHYIRKKDEINNIIDRINKLSINLIMDIKSQTDFIKYDAIDTSFHINKTSYNLDLHSRLKTNIQETLNSFKKDKYLSQLNIRNELDTLEVLLNNIDNEFENIVMNIKLRGFKDYGIEGEMRTYAHMLEKSQINPTYVLSLRRHEKDYIIRKEARYINQLNQLGAEFKTYIKNHSNSGSRYSDSLNNILNKYLFEFNKMVKIEEEIGLYKSNGIIQSLERQFAETTSIIEQVNNNVYVEKTNMFKKLELNTIIFFIVLVTTIIIVCISLSKYITDPLNSLTSFISGVTENNFKFSKFPEFGNPDRELTILITEFKKMFNQMHINERERDIAEASLRENETKYRNLSDMLPQSVFETDYNCKLTYYNKTLAETILNDPSSSNKELYISEILRTDSETLLEHDYSIGVDYIAYKNNGETFPVLLYASRIIRNNTFIGLRGIMVDITEKKRYTEELQEQKLKAEQADKLKTAFLANMSHEIRTPMNSIVGFSQILTLPDIDLQTKHEYAGYIRNSSDLLLKIINDILDISRIESGQFSLEYSDFDLNPFMDKVGAQANEIMKIHKKEHLNVKIVNNFENEAFMINSDILRLEQVLINLITNAVKFTSSGLIEIGYEPKKNNKIGFYVKDTGIGIEAQKIDLVFERFVQIEEVNRKQQQGTGLGLSISKSIIELMGGTIGVHSVVNQGSVFFFEIPCVIRLNPEPNQKVTLHTEVARSYFKGEKLLIAEDVDYSYILLREGLKPLGMEIMHASNGAEALKTLILHPEIEIVLMDMRMPVMDGYEASAKIKALNPSVYIIATTAYAFTGDEEKCIRAGCDFYLSKPIKIEALIKRIGTVLLKKTKKHKTELTNTTEA